MRAAVTCALIQRDAGGILRLLPGTLELDGAAILRDYQHVERLQGWPQPLVYWPTPTGECIGVAPLRADGLVARRTGP